jgi:hypothetical protein
LDGFPVGHDWLGVRLFPRGQAGHHYRNHPLTAERSAGGNRLFFNDYDELLAWGGNIEPKVFLAFREKKEYKLF